MAKDPSALGSALATIKRTHGDGAIMSLGQGAAVGDEPVSFLSTGSLGLDLATGIGGYPRGRVVELYGPQGGGKTTLALHAIAGVQASGGVASFIDSSHALSIDYARAVGVDPAKLLVSQPDTAEQAFDIIEVLARSGAVDLVVVDGLPRPRAAVEGELYDEGGDAGIAARLMSQTLRKLTAIAHRTGTTILFTRTAETRDGANALKFYASMRLEARSHAVPGDDRRRRVTVRIVKNKCASPFTDASFAILEGKGIDRADELVTLALEYGVAGIAEGGGFTIEETPICHVARARETVASSTDLQAKLRAAIPARAGRS